MLPSSRTNTWKEVQSNLETMGKIRVFHKEMDLLSSSENLIEAAFIEQYGNMFDEKIISITECNARVKEKVSCDVPRTFAAFTQLPSFEGHLGVQEKQLTSLSNILLLACSDTGYCQGINFLGAAFLLTQGNEKMAFICLVYTLKNCRLYELLYGPSHSSGLAHLMDSFDKQLKIRNKLLYGHLLNIGVSSTSYCMEWFTTCFILADPRDLGICVLDLLLVGIDPGETLIAVGFALLDLLEKNILNISTLEEFYSTFKDLVKSLSTREILSRALSLIKIRTRMKLADFCVVF